ncbi:membrane-targeted effector domain-containing toxin [Pseudomonas fluorescens]|uniref:Dermonecrotic toxin N-terminal domain-containing protein n=1 Tax=Pseudomonas fluorescens TaxID=294 RepID=A0A0F4SY21_PSEFL|nr:membrane-targeted effector domain-containing toxin [Pseudomonas fluorescens]KJZ36794.1 hypothetical protein VC34_26670 [Pseudomonas fluorescens]
MDDAQELTLPDAADALALKALIPDLVADCPDMYAMAYQVAKDILVQHHITDIEPDKVYWHRFRAAQSSSKTFTGWQHVFEKPRESMTFPQLVMQRFSVHDQDNADLLDADSGFYRVGADAGNYDETNEVRLHARDALKAFWDINFSDRYKTAIATFWEKHSANFRALAKCTFIAKAIEDYEKGYLTREHFTLVLRAATANVSRPLTRQMLLDEAPTGSGLSIRQFCIDHFVSTDIFSITDDSDLNILYVPGEPRAFHCFTSVEQLHEWLVNEVKDAEGRERMLMHFKQEERDILQERPASLLHKLANLTNFGLIIHTFEETHFDNVGLTHAYDLLPGEYEVADHHLLHYRGEQIAGDAFTHLNQSTHERMLSDGNFLLHSNGEIRKKLWIGYLNAFSHTFGPMAALAWPAALVVVGAGIANVGLHIDQAINGHTPAERKAAVTGAILGSVDVLFNLPFLRGAAELAETSDFAEITETEETLASGPEPKSEVELTPSPTLPFETVVATPADADILAPFETNEVLDGDFPVSDEGKYQGIYQPRTGGNYIAVGDRFYQVRYSNELKTWIIIDPTNPYSFFRNIPVRLNEAGEWVPVTRPGLAGGGKFADLFAPAEPALPDFDAPATQYDVPQELKAELKKASEGGSVHGLDDNFVDITNPNDKYHVFKKLRRQLHDDAVSYYSDLHLPPKPEIPSFIPAAKPKDIIKTIFNRSPGLVVGESHSSAASKRFLIENMKVLRQQKIRTLYMEHLQTDFQQHDLDVFNRTGVMSEDLQRYLKNLDRGHFTDASGKYTFEQVVRAAQKNRIRVQAIDCMASYHSTGNSRMLSTADNFRQKMMNYFAHQVISADQAARGAHRWVALVGNTHTNTFYGVAGVSELEGSIGLRIDGLREGELAGIKADPGFSSKAELGQAPVFVKNDLLLTIKTSQELHPLPTLEDHLKNPGMFTINDSNTVLTHRGRAIPDASGITPPKGNLVRTDILRDGHQFYIIRDSWSWISGKRFESVADLRAALEKGSMTFVSLPGL